mgnify:CR=1 FL=1
MIKFIISFITAIVITFSSFAIHHYFGDPFGAIALIVSIIGGAYFLGIIEAKFFN